MSCAMGAGLASTPLNTACALAFSAPSVTCFEPLSFHADLGCKWVGTWLRVELGTGPGWAPCDRVRPRPEARLGELHLHPLPPHRNRRLPASLHQDQAVAPRRGSQRGDSRTPPAAASGSN